MQAGSHKRFNRIWQAGIELIGLRAAGDIDSHFEMFLQWSWVRIVYLRMERTTRGWRRKKDKCYRSKGRGTLRYSLTTTNC